MLNIKIKTVKEPEPILLNKYVLQGFRVATKHIVTDVKNSFGQSGKPKVRSGDLKKSIQGQVKQQGDTFTATLSSDTPYSRIQEEGGRITAKGKWLKFKIQNQFVTVKSVTIPARPYMKPAILNNLETIKEYITDAVIKGSK